MAQFDDSVATAKSNLDWHLPVPHYFAGQIADPPARNN